MKMEASEMNRDEPFRQKLRNPEYRRKFLHTLVLFASFLVLGICDTIHFPAFLDLALLTGSDVEQASVFYTSMAVGGLVGTLGMGVLFDKLPSHRSLLLAGANLGSAFTITAIPWSTNFYLTIFLFFICYVFNLAFDTGTHADLLGMWGADGKMFMQFLHFSYSLGSIISPLMAEPFLAEKVAENDTLCEQNKLHYSTSPVENISSAGILNNYGDVNSNITLESNQLKTCRNLESRIHYAYLIAGIMCFLTAIVLVAEAYTKCINTRRIKATEDQRPSGNLPKYLNIILLILITSLYFFMCAPGNTVPSYLMPFGVNGRGWTKESTAYLTSIYWSVFAVSRLVAVVAIKYLSPAKLLAVCFSVLTVSMGGLWASIAANSDPGIWACIIASSGGYSVSFPTGFIYVEKDIMKVSGMVASVIMLASNGAGIANPLLVGYLMQEVSVRWYIYLSLGQVLLAFIIFIILQMLLRIHLSELNNARTIEVDVGIQEESVKCAVGQGTNCDLGDDEGSEEDPLKAETSG